MRRLLAWIWPRAKQPAIRTFPQILEAANGCVALTALTVTWDEVMAHAPLRMALEYSQKIAAETRCSQYDERGGFFMFAGKRTRIAW